MTEESGAAPSATTTATATTRHHLPPNAALDLAARLFATAGAGLFAVAAWLPWEYVTGTLRSGGESKRYDLQISPGDVTHYGGVFGWSLLTVLGVLLCGVLWQRLHPRAYVLVGCTFILWFLAVSLSSQPLTLDATTFATMFPGTSVTDVRIEGQQHLVGFWLGVVALSLALVGSVLLAQSFFRRQREWVLADASRGVARPVRPLVGAGAFTLGLALWALGFFELPWATDNCTATPLLIGSCVGIGANGTLAYTLSGPNEIFDPLAARFAVGLLLGGGALLLVIGLWRRLVTPAFCLWATLWLAVAIVLGIAADQGVATVVDHSADLGLPAGVWRGDSGILLALLGLLIVAGALVPLWWMALRRPARE